MPGAVWHQDIVVVESNGEIVAPYQIRILTTGIVLRSSRNCGRLYEYQFQQELVLFYVLHRPSPATCPTDCDHMQCSQAGNITVCITTLSISLAAFSNDYRNDIIPE
jgi:hypothetical protein